MFPEEKGQSWIGYGLRRTLDSMEYGVGLLVA
jgi:hypothetical protein